MSGPYAFAGPDWINAARSILEDLVRTHGEPGRTFSVCETFTGAPPEVASSGTAAWHFQIDGKTAKVGPGPLPEADVQIRNDYTATLPVARLVYTPEVLARRAADRESGKAPPAAPGMAKAPPYLVELHNRLAAVTA